ncbi:CoA-acylating methylmalonate-semialdehyde dehydrogenase [Nesterenkonia salmonea]|uniref:methylmalonate-semialdehyde dehydrogenase (CoA acylating) n=1 Tax=Nesterenkonia salmonea TaxID=1804987 RepID=A0A5R9BLW2_9MICC|nr:CoA-acylating methylmalonate-semialdehyde dehydrogenase [Nesterenkonia salmonea]TLQ01103.1 CoA-acylating methylmalonate-semialdehyde dehydrogenase [Nesterenkonia salmonea]
MTESSSATRTLSTAATGHWIGGETVTPAAEPSIAVDSPTTGELITEIPLASQETVDHAVATAKEAFSSWGSISLSKRTQIIFRYRELLNARKGELAQIISREHGKVFSDALGEVQRGLEVVEFACGIPHLLKGSQSVNASTDVDVHSARHPLGPVAIITPFNFPAMVPMWFTPLAVATGNTVVIKPSEKDPSAVNWQAELWKEAGLPDGVVNVLHGDKGAVDGLLNHPDIEAVSFVGSTPVAQYVYETGTAAGKRVQALGGAKNHMMVLPDANLDRAADSAVSAGYGSAGERCMAISVVVAVGDIADELVAKIAERTRGLRLDGDNPDLGPLINRAHRDKVRSYVDGAESEGASLVVDGRSWAESDKAEAAYLGPTLLDHVGPQMKSYQDEIFGPVLSVVRAETYHEALELINSNPYGNGTAIFTRDGAAARRFEMEVTVGMIGVNVPIPVPMAYYSFGGWKNSLFGDSHAHGAEGVNFYTRGKVVTARWGDPSEDGMQLGFPQND